MCHFLEFPHGGTHLINFPISRAVRISKLTGMWKMDWDSTVLFTMAHQVVGTRQYLCFPVEVSSWEIRSEAILGVINKGWLNRNPVGCWGTDGNMVIFWRTFPPSLPPTLPWQPLEISQNLRKKEAPIVTEIEILLGRQVAQKRFKLDYRKMTLFYTWWMKLNPVILHS